MPNPLSGYITAWRQDYITVSGNLWSAGSMLQNAGNAIKIQQFASCGTNLINAKDNLHAAALAFQVGASNMYDNMYAAMHWIDNNIGGGGSVDMEAILAAMWAGNKLENFHFITYIDAMRASIWNVEIMEQHLESDYMHFQGA